jgi:hypothetical protein
VIFEVLSGSAFMALAAIAAQGKLTQQSRRAGVVARIEEPRNVRQIRFPNAQTEDAVRRTAIYERRIALHGDDPAARPPKEKSMAVDAMVNNTRNDGRSRLTSGSDRFQKARAGMTCPDVQREHCHADGSNRPSKETRSQRVSRMLDYLDVLSKHIAEVLCECTAAPSGELQSPRENSVLLP